MTCEETLNAIHDNVINLTNLVIELQNKITSLETEVKKNSDAITLLNKMIGG